jgi:hypothetical protein
MSTDQLAIFLGALGVLLALDVSAKIALALTIVFLLLVCLKPDSKSGAG